MKAAVLKNNNKIEIKELKTPELKEKGAIIKVQGCGLCGSDVVKIRSGIAKQGAVLGHEIVGVISQINTSTDFKVGDKIALGHHVPCFNCEYCKGESYSMCKTFKKTNIMPGGFCEYLAVSEEHLKHTVCKIPAEMENHTASFVEPLACCVRAIKRADIKPNDKVLVIGLGSIGLLLGQVAKHYGAKVLGCDILEERISWAKKLGFADAIKYENEASTLEQVKTKAKTAIGFDKVILSAGNDSAANFSLKAIRDGGNIVIFSSVKSNQTSFSNNEIYYRELSIIASYSPSPFDIKEAFELLKNDTIKVSGLSTEYDITSLQEAIDDFCSNKIIKAYIKI